MNGNIYPAERISEPKVLRDKRSEILEACFHSLRYSRTDTISFRGLMFV